MTPVTTHSLVSGIDIRCACRRCGVLYKEDLDLTTSQYTPACTCLPQSPLVVVSPREEFMTMGWVTVSGTP